MTIQELFKLKPETEIQVEGKTMWLHNEFYKVSTNGIYCYMGESIEEAIQELIKY